jgi:predicted nucleotidyltransferase component of viral defense system
MITRRDLQRRAAALGIAEHHAQLDYVLHHLLAQFARDPRGLVFRGGTALARIYWPDFRISEDLDFIAVGELPDLQGQIERAARYTADEAGLDLSLDVGGWRDDRLRATVGWAPDGAPDGELVIDVVRHQRPALPPVTLPLDLRYPDIAGSPGLAIPVLQLDEILANKWLMLESRDEPRDLFDLWWAFAREDVRFDDLAVAHRAAFGYPPMSASIERAARLERAWRQRLEHQLNNLLPFGEALDAVRRHFETWRSSAE